MAINCDAARELGMTAVVFENAEQTRIEVEAALAQEPPRAEASDRVERSERVERK